MKLLVTHSILNVYSLDRFRENQKNFIQFDLFSLRISIIMLSWSSALLSAFIIFNLHLLVICFLNNDNPEQSNADRLLKIQNDFMMLQKIKMSKHNTFSTLIDISKENTENYVDYEQEETTKEYFLSNRSMGTGPKFRCPPCTVKINKKCRIIEGCHN